MKQKLKLIQDISDYLDIPVSSIQENNLRDLLARFLASIVNFDVNTTGESEAVRLGFHIAKEAMLSNLAKAMKDVGVTNDDLYSLTLRILKDREKQKKF